MATTFMRRMVLVYGAPDTDEPEAFIAEYARILKAYADDILDAALDRLLRTRKFKTWPSIAECVGAAEDERAARASLNKPQPKRSDFAREANEMLMTPLGAKAAHEGWVLGLYDHVFRNGTRPTNSEIYDLIDNAKFVDRCAAGAIDMGVAHAMLLRLAKNMLIRREGLARRALDQPPLTDAEKREMRA